jgi:hypothetical protein
VKIVFKERDGASGGERTVARLHFRAAELREGRDGPLIARHVGHAWVVSGAEYLRLDCEGPVRVRFADEQGASSAQYGPYSHFSSVNGIVFADHLVLAHLDTKSERWYVISDGGEWAAFSVDPA